MAGEEDTYRGGGMWEVFGSWWDNLEDAIPGVREQQESPASHDTDAGGKDAWIQEQVNSAEKTRGREEYVDENGKDGLQEADLNKNIEFNPPLHKTLRMSATHAMPDATSDYWNKGGGDEPKNAPHNFGEGNTKILFEPDHDTGEARSASDWRLGQILPGDSELVDTGRSPVRYGFRFLYNPTSINFSTQVNESIHTDPSTINGQSVLFMKSGLGQVSMQLLLNRIPDVMLGSGAAEPTELFDHANQEALGRGIWNVHEKGTEFDLEYLFRTINGIWNLRDTGAATTSDDGASTGGSDDDDGGVGGTANTGTNGIDPDISRSGLFPGMTGYVDPDDGSDDDDDDDDDSVEAYRGYHTGDIGLLLPTPVWVSVGPTMKYYGRVVGMSHEHFMFSRGMVPVLTRLTITFQRIFRGTPDDTDVINKGAATSSYNKEDQFVDGDDDDDDGSGDSDGNNISGTSGIKIIDQPSGHSNKKYIWKTLLMNDYSPQQAAGIMGNLQQESSFDPKANQPNGPGRGLAQWTEGARWEGVKRMANGRDGYGPESIEIQMEFMMKEMKDGWGNFSDKDFRALNIVDQACSYFHTYYEGSADTAIMIERRIRYAVAIYQDFHEKKHMKGYSISSGGQVDGWPVDKEFVVTGVYGTSKGGKGYSCSGHPNVMPYGHTGVDINTPSGKNIYALKDGTLKHVSNTMGIEVMVVSGSGYNWRYCHLSSRGDNGKKVKKGDIIGKTGDTNGSNYPYDTIGAHLHLECYMPGLTNWACPNFVDPEPVLNKSKTRGLIQHGLLTHGTVQKSGVTTPIQLSDYIGETPYVVSARRRHLYQKIDGKYWVAQTPSSIRHYPRNPFQAVRHGIEAIAQGVIPPEPWVGRPMAAVARCYGLWDGETEKIPARIFGPKNSPARQFRWMTEKYPHLAVVAPHTRSFGNDVPIGAILYWDEGTGGGYGSVGIAMGYRHGLLQQMTTAPGSSTMVITDVPPNRCMGWTVPMFFAEPSFVAYGLLDTIESVSESDRHMILAGGR